MEYAETLKRNAKKLNRNILSQKPTDCKHCYGASAGIMGVHYSCNCEKSKMYCNYPLILCPENCEFYEREKTIHE